VAWLQTEPGPDGFLLEAGGAPYGLGLGKQTRFAADQPCVFLMRLTGEYERCGVYADRPVTCRAYPMSLWQGLVFQRNDALCPPGGRPAGEPRRPAWRVALQRFHMQFTIYHEVVARWNARVARAGARFTPAEYFSYLLNVYDQLEARAALAPEAVARAEATWPALARGRDWTSRPPPGPWLDYLREARAVIDTFYPAVPPLPLIALSDAPAVAFGRLAEPVPVV
jgi:hypothetical protein